MDSWTLIIVIGALALVVLDVFIPSGGLLSGVGIAALIERGLEAVGVAGPVRWPMAAVGMLVTVAVVIRFGERLSESLFPARVRTNIDRLIGLEGRVQRLADGGPIVDLEGDLWTCRTAPDSPAPAAGARVVVEAMVDQVPVVRVLDAS
ncbi:MAG: hypothetical protein KC549_10615 [Myxococcales bacterium]|nr:hypothetical protein [Myxococcales bacterium]MCB9545760.1 hypothetical protein [Myxococcales bacterium]